MLSRVSAALSQFIKPIASSTEVPQQGFKRFTPPKEDPEKEHKQDDPKDDPPQPGAEIIPFPKSKAEEKQAAGPPEQKAAPPGLSVAHSFIQILSSFSAGKTVLGRWIGGRAYQSSDGNRRVGKYRKGSILDRKAE